MNAADWFWLGFLCFLLLAVVVLSCRDINRRRDENRGAIDAERIARENAQPNGSVDVWGWPR